MKLVIEKEFKTRADLDSFILSRLGSNQEENLKHEIELSEEEAGTMSLSEDTKVYGVRVVLKKKPVEKLKSIKKPKK